MCTGRFDSVQDFRERPEDGLALFGLLFDSRFKQQMNVVGHHARRVQLVFPVFVPMQCTAHYNVALSRGQFLSFVSREGDSVFSPGTLEMWEASFGVVNISGRFRRGAG